MIMITIRSIIVIIIMLLMIMIIIITAIKRINSNHVKNNANANIENRNNDTS